jgi:hypothetical protein
MDQPSSSSPHREDAAPKIDEVERIASQMSWDDMANIGVQFGNDDADDLKNEGPGIVHGGWVDGQWHDPIDSHPNTPRERHSRLEFDPDYIPDSVQVMTTRD